MVGILAGVIGVFDILISRYQLKPLYRWTVWLRYFAAAFMVCLWAMGEVEIGILMFAAIDVGGATWTLLTMRASQTTG
jgi:hypothetical protein